MNLGFNEIFIPKIISGSKIHTIRKDSFNRWGAGKLIHICTGLKTKEYKLHLIKDCVSVQRFDIFWSWSEELNKNTHNVFVDKKFKKLQQTMGLKTWKIFYLAIVGIINILLED